MPNPSTSAVVGTLGPQVVAQGALQAVGPAVSGASIAPGITVGGLFVAPLFVPALIARIFSKPSPTAAFEVPEMSMPRGTNIAQFGDTFKNVNGGIIPAALTVPGFTRGRLSRQEKSAGASASFVAQDLQRAAFAEFAINPPQAELATKFLNAHMKPGPRPTGPVVGSVAWHRSKRTGGGRYDVVRRTCTSMGAGQRKQAQRSRQSSEDCFRKIARWRPNANHQLQRPCHCISSRWCSRRRTPAAIQTGFRRHRSGRFFSSGSSSAGDCSIRTQHAGAGGASTARSSPSASTFTTNTGGTNHAQSLYQSSRSRRFFCRP